MVRRGSQCRAPTARNNKQAFSYSNKYQASGERGGAADEEEVRGESKTGGWLLCYTEAFLRIMSQSEESKAGSDRFIISIDCPCIKYWA